jgi:hypothetical protein
MPASTLQDLAQQFCDAAQMVAPVLTPDSDGNLAFSTRIRDVDFTITHDPASQPENALILVFLGQIPADREVLILRELLHANLLMLQPGSPSFSRNPLTGSILLQYSSPLTSASGESLRAGMEGIIDMVHAWREDFFLEANGPPTSPSLFNMLGSLA